MYRFLASTLPLILCVGWLRAEESERFWSFRPLAPQTLPSVADKNWPKQRLDHFILAKLESNGLSPAGAADERTLLRRLSFVLTGLPPTAEDVEQLQISEIEAKIDELLSSPHYGERWARHWLDLARYTDTTASWLESTASAWRYRDWVVRAFNEDLPYDAFVRRQLATDLMADTPPEENAALGFFGLSPTYWKELQLPPEIIKTTVADEWEERMDVLGRTFMGLTLGCARCHDHKTDPITVADYYALAGVFASVRISDRPMMAEDLWVPVKAARAQVASLEKQVKDLKKKKPEDLEAKLAELEGKIAEQKKTPHYDMATANGIAEAALFVKNKTKGHGTNLDYQAGKARDLEIQRRGNPNDLGETVPRRFLSAFPTENGKPREFDQGSGRLQLANAMLEDAKPLMARVIVNRVWQHHFGRGLVTTPSDFGRMGDRPTHPALLEDLAFRFVENGWSIKWLHREILNSATWQQSPQATESEAQDPENQFYGRMLRRRLDIEAYRDAALAASGNLERTLGGAPQDLTSSTNVRRTIYGKIHRRDLNKMLQVHDFPDPAAHGASRDETTSPLQALFALNGPLIEAQAKALAERIQNEADPIESAYRALFQRSPTPRERQLAEAFLATRDDAWQLYAQALLSSNEFLFID